MSDHHKDARQRLERCHYDLSGPDRRMFEADELRTVELVASLLNEIDALIAERDEARRWAELLLKRNSLAGDPLQPPIDPPWRKKA